ncbi:MAG: hypothetical protein A4E20_01410 [Nitrospira sp. SG-bin2]|uniref:hypothetical protein n=1 Tax=Nitrospira cf. moscoviensis SBR1015 TaxID=96242 RepID=UPI000A0E730F|nr:hypothetical protein [Nitrospira cf. moscoviensis SBR1015]OQW34862.1 MAG: hypothetical protein A4E20_01410 [Nitrospira sp. SG-bin2]
MEVPYGATKQSLYFMLTDSTTGARKTGVAHTAVTGSYCRNQGSRVAITMANLAAANSVWASGGWEEIDAVNQPGLYRFDVPNAAFTFGTDADDQPVTTVEVTVTATGAHSETKEIELTYPIITQGTIGATINNQPTFTEHTMLDGTVRKDYL